MTNQKGFAPVAIILIIIGALALGGGAWYYKSQGKIKKQITSFEDFEETKKAEKILIRKNSDESNNNFELDLLTNELTQYKNIYDNILKFDSFPSITKNEDNGAMFDIILFSQDRNEVLMYGKTNGEFRCVINSKKCFTTKIITDSRKILEENKGGLCLYAWDSSNGFVFAHKCGQGMGPFSPVSIVNVNTKSYKETVGYNPMKNGKEAMVPTGAFSPSLKKFVMINENSNATPEYRERSWQILLYNSENLLKPEKIFEFPVKIKHVFTQPSPGYYFVTFGLFKIVDWSPDEKFVALSSSNEIYLLDLMAGQFNLVYKGNDPVYELALSSGGRFIVFTDDFKNLKSIDLQRNNLVTELGEGSLIPKEGYPGYLPYVQ